MRGTFHERGPHQTSRNPSRGCRHERALPPLAVAPTAAASYLGEVDDPVIAPSALRHGLDEIDILHAYRNPVRIWDLGDGFTMIIGPTRAAIFLEVGYVQGEQKQVVVHAMLAREKFLR